MGALTELMDKYVAEKGYYEAKDIWETLEYLFPAPEVFVSIEDRKKIIDYIVKKYEGDRTTIKYTIKDNLYHFWNIENKRYFFFYPWIFGEEYKDSIEEIKKICDNTNGLSYRERMSTDNDFFLFHPQEHDMGLEITDTRNRSPKEMNAIRGRIRIKNQGDQIPGTVQYLRFGW